MNTWFFLSRSSGFLQREQTDNYSTVLLSAVMELSTDDVGSRKEGYLTKVEGKMEESIKEGFSRRDFNGALVFLSYIFNQNYTCI